MTSLPETLAIRIAPDGSILALFDDALVRDIPGAVAITRATLIEPLPDGTWGVWDARTGQVGDPLFHAPTRAACLIWEQQWVNAVHLGVRTAAAPAS